MFDCLVAFEVDRRLLRGKGVVLLYDQGHQCRNEDSNFGTFRSERKYFTDYAKTIIFAGCAIKDSPSRGADEEEIKQFTLAEEAKKCHLSRREEITLSRSPHYAHGWSPQNRPLSSRAGSDIHIDTLQEKSSLNKRNPIFCSVLRSELIAIDVDLRLLYLRRITNRSQKGVEWRVPPIHHWYAGYRPGLTLALKCVTDAPRHHSLVLPVVTSRASRSQRTKRSSPGVNITRLPPNT
ncbi:hypothetical protein TNCV_1425821 [Trichonephila clavipes]|nr:hypothetical protein TNCV_1425821 [Trichonephila clavipes]